MYQRILVPLDGSQEAEAVLPFAERLANGFKAGIVLMNVLDEEAVSSLFRQFGSKVAEEQSARLAAVAETYVDGVAKRVKLTVGQVSTIVTIGNVPSEIAKEAERVQDTLIAMCTHGSSGVGRFLMGSVATKVLHSTKVPLLLLRQGEASPAVISSNLKTVVVPLDGSELAEQALAHAELLAKTLGLGVLIVRATPTLAEFYGPLGADSSYVPADLFEVMEKDALAYLSAKAGELRSRGVADVRSKHMAGQPASSILDLVRDTPGCLVAITTHGRSGFGRWVLGSVADRLVSHSDAPVLVIRPRA